MALVAYYLNKNEIHGLVTKKKFNLISKDFT